MSPTFEQAQEAWKIAIGQLRYTMNRADFDAWVRDARLLAYEANTLHVGVANAYAREWLTSRLQNTLEHLLSGLLGRATKVAFEVVSARVPVRAYGTTVPQDSLRLSHTPHLDLSALSLKLRDALLQPQRVVFLPGYFLRWLPYVGSRAGWLYVALRQAHFLANLNPYGPGHKIPTGQAVEVQRATLAYWSALTPRTINNILNRGILEPLVRAERDRHTYANRQAPNKYIFTADLPLTPHDFQTVMSFLKERGLNKDPVAALAQAIQQPGASFLSDKPFIPPATPVKTAVTLREAIAEHMQGLNLPQEEMAKALRMAEILESTIVDSAGKIFITWYFIQNQLPRLGHTLAWIYLVLRHYAERQGNQGKGGFRILRTSTREIAQQIRLKKARYVRDLIPPFPLDAPPDVHNPPAAAFLRREATRGATFRVAVQMIEPLTPTDEAAYRAATELMAACIKDKDLSPLQTIQHALQAGQMEEAVAIIRKIVRNDSEETVLRRAAEALAAISTETPKISHGNEGANPQQRQNLPADAPKSSPGSANSFPR